MPSASSWSRPLLARALPPDAVTRPDRSVNRPPASSTMTFRAARSHTRTSSSVATSAAPSATRYAPPEAPDPAPAPRPAVHLGESPQQAAPPPCPEPAVAGLGVLDGGHLRHADLAPVGERPLTGCGPPPAASERGRRHHA